MNHDETTSSQKRITRPAQLLHGGGGANTPSDHEIRYQPYNPERENKN